MTFLEACAEMGRGFGMRHSKMPKGTWLDTGVDGTRRVTFCSVDPVAFTPGYQFNLVDIRATDWERG